MNHLLIRPLTIALLLGAAISTSRAAFNYTETFGIDNNAAGWSQLALADAASVSQNPLTDRLDFSATNFSLLFLIADDSASLGAFTGNYAAPQISALGFHLALDSGAIVTELYAELTNLTEDETWQFALTPNAAGTGATFAVPIDPLGTGWSQVSGDQSFAFLLADVEGFSIILGNTSGAGSASGSIDNVTVVPEPTTTILAALGALGMLRRRRTTGL